MPVVLITGAGGNVGQVTVRQFLQAGWDVVATVSPNKSWPGPTHPRLMVSAIDLRHEDAVNTWLSEKLRLHPIDAAMLLAGGFAAGPLHLSTGELLQEMIELNARTAWHVARPLTAHMLARKKGRLVFIGAKSALNMNEASNALAYAFSKSLLFRFSEAINAMGKAHQVKSYVLVPHIIDTPGNRKAIPVADNREYLRWTSPRTMAELMVRLADPDFAMEASVIKLYEE